MLQLGDIGITQQDIAQMLQANPLAAEQLKSIALARQNAELQTQMEELRNGQKKEEVPAKEGSESS